MNDRNRKVKLNKKSMVMIGAAFLIVLAVAALMCYMDHRSTGTSEGSGKKVYTIDGEECYKKTEHRDVFVPRCGRCRRQ